MLDDLVVAEAEVHGLVVDHLEGALVQLRDRLFVGRRVQDDVLLVHLESAVERSVKNCPSPAFSINLGIT